MTVYTGLLDEEIDGIPVVPPADVNDGDRVRPVFELVEQFEAEDGECFCHILGPNFSRLGMVCNAMHFQWKPGLPALRFDRPFTPPYVSEVRCG